MNRKDPSPRRLTLWSLLLLSSAGALWATPQDAQAQVVRPFAARYSENATGDIHILGNTLMSCDPTLSMDCQQARDGVANTMLERNNNNDHAMRYVDVDNDPTTFNSSRSSYTLPIGAEVLWAGLYWGGRPAAGQQGVAAPTPAQRNRVKFSSPETGGYVDITATRCDEAGGTFNDYQCFAEVTRQVPPTGGGQYTVANVQLGTGLNRFGGWGLVIVYNDPAEPTRNLVVYDGFAQVLRDDMLMQRSININVSGFLTPAQGDVFTRVGAIVYEGDLDAPGDSFVLAGRKLSDAANPENNFFNASNAINGVQVSTKAPNYKNLLGFDLNIVEARNVLANSARNTTITLQTTGDTYFPGVVTFSTDIYAPRVTAIKTITDVNGGEPLPGDELEYRIEISNTGNDPADNVVLEDALPSQTTFVPGSIRIDNQARTEQRDNDQAEVVNGTLTARLGQGANAGQGGSLGTNQSTILTFRVRINDSVTANTSIQNQATVEYRARTLDRNFFVLSDGDGNASGSSPTVIVVEGRPGMVDILTPANGSLTRDSRPMITGSAEPNAQVTVTLDGGQPQTTTADAQGRWTVTPSQPLGDGQHTVTARSGTQAVDTHTFTVDTIPPMLTITSPVDGSSTSNTQPTLSGTSEPGAMITIVIDGGAPIMTTADAQGNWSARPSSPLSEGEHKVDVTATDAAGNSSMATVTFTVDGGAPSLTLDSPTSGATVTTDKPRVEGTAAPGARVKVTVQSTGEELIVTADTEGKWYANPTQPLPSGSNTISATLEGQPNAPTERVTFTVDAGPNSGGTLVVTSPRPGDSTGTTTTVTGTATPGSTIVITVDGQEVGRTTANPDGSWSVDVMLPEGQVTITVTAVDPNGGSQTVTVGVTVDASVDGRNMYIVRGGSCAQAGGRAAAPDAALWLALCGMVVALVTRRRRLA